MAGVIAWVCRTPRRLLAVLAVPLLLVVLVASMWSRVGDGSDADGSQVSAAAGAQVPDATPFVTAAVRFVNVWGRLAPGQSTEQWHSAVRALATPQLASALDNTDPQSLPGSTATGKATVRYVTSADAIVAVPLSNGSTVVVSVITADGKTWLVRDIQPDQGN